MLAERRPQQLRGLDHQRVDVDPRGCSGCLRAKASRRWVSSAPRSAASSIILAIAASSRPVGDGLGQDLEGAGDDGQDVVEVVGDAAGQLADGLHLLRLAQLGFGGAFFREVAADEEVAPHRLGPRSHPVQHNLAAVLVDVARLEAAHLLSTAG